MSLPVLPGAHLRGAAGLIDKRLLKLGGVPGGDPERHRRPIRDLPQYTLGSCAVVGGVGVQTNPAVSAGVVTGNRIPQRRYAPAQWAQGAGEPEGGQARVDADQGQAPGVLFQQPGYGLAGSPDAGAGQLGDSEG